MKELDAASSKLDIEIKDIEQTMKENQKVLSLLKEPFTTTFKPMTKNYPIFNEEAYRPNEADLETNDDNDENIKLTLIEEVVKAKIDCFLKKYGGKYVNILLVF